MQFTWTIVLALYILSVLWLTRIPYQIMVKRGMQPIRAVYYTRKIVHIFAGGLGSLIVPIVFTNFWYPLISGLLLTLLVAIAHATGLRFYWFQTAENRNDVKFALMWSISVAFLWWMLGNPWLAVLPGLYMAFGDGVTGIVRNALIQKRSKHPIGNLFMLLLCAPLGWWIGNFAQPPIPIWGLLSAVVATVIERYEFGPIDDNILITVSASAILLLGTFWGDRIFQLLF